jgi:hypothetical protein
VRRFHFVALFAELCWINIDMEIPISERFQGVEWCCKRGLNSRPLPYRGSAFAKTPVEEVYGSRDQTEI